MLAMSNPLTRVSIVQLTLGSRTAPTLI
jgi:hypothetical protein